MWVRGRGCERIGARACGCDGVHARAWVQGLECGCRLILSAGAQAATAPAQPAGQKNVMCRSGPST
eukprot:363901-Chlamydomonas_euryale.AAC.43